MAKPINSFLVFCSSNRNKVKDEYPNRSNAEISSILGEKWRNLSTKEKKSYKELALLNKQVRTTYWHVKA